MEIMYRTESYSGTGERSAREVIAYEIGELNNTDILETLLEKKLLTETPCSAERYPNAKASPWYQMSVADKARAMINEIEENDFVDDMSEEEFLLFADEILDSVRAITGIEVRYALWLVNKTGLMKHYSADMYDASDYSAYEVGPIVLSDMGEDGLLYGYTKLPQPLEIDLEPLQFTDVGNVFVCKDIIWDTDGENVDLPKTVQFTESYLTERNYFENGITDNVALDRIADALSDKYGWCVKGFQMDMLECGGQE